MINFLSNAILVKIRAKYAKRLSLDDYKVLLSSESVSKVASYLKNKDIYCNSLSKMGTDIHRGPLEKALMQGFFEDLSTLANYDLKFSKKIFKYILIRSEIKQINKFLTFLKSGNFKNFECFLPQFLKSKSKINFDKFNQIENHQSLISFLSKSQYYDSLKEFKDDKNFDINFIETSLYNYQFQTILNYIYKLGKITNETKKFFYKCIDILNIIRVIRAKKVCNPSDEYISKIIFQFDDYKFNDYDIVEEKLSSKFGNEILSVRKLEKMFRELKFKWAKKNIRYSNIPEIIGYSYISLKEIEIMNVIKIIEGVRYKLPSDKIERMLIK